MLSLEEGRDPVDLGVVVLQALTNLLLLEDKTASLPTVGHTPLRTPVDNLINSDCDVVCEA